MDTLDVLFLVQTALAAVAASFLLVMARRQKSILKDYETSLYHSLCYAHALAVIRDLCGRRMAEGHRLTGADTKQVKELAKHLVQDASQAQLLNAAKSMKPREKTTIVEAGGEEISKNA